MSKTTGRNKLKPFMQGLIAIILLVGVAFIGAQSGNRAIIAADEPDGPTKAVIVTFKDAAVVSSGATQARQQEAISNKTQTVQDELPYSEGYKQMTRSYSNLPFAAYTVDAAGEASLRNDPNVASVVNDELHAPALYEAVATIGGSTTTGFSDGTSLYTGSGYSVAILDTGVRSTHSMLSGKIIAEACFGVNQVYTNATVTSLCPGGVTSSTASGSGADCESTVATGCGHGTHVASIAAGAPVSATIDSQSETLSGVAMDSDIIAVNVFSQVESLSLCGSADPCVMSMTSSQLAAFDFLLDGIIGNSFSSPLAAINMSLGGSPFHSSQSQCDAQPEFTSFNSTLGVFASHGVPTVIATGNDGDTAANIDKIATPACLSGAVAVSATNKAGTEIASYANNGVLTDLLAPGGDYDGVNAWSMIIAADADSDSGLVAKRGTSMATPMVAGAFAVLRERHENASVSQLLGLLQQTGTAVADSRTDYTVGSKPLIQLDAALAASPDPVITSFTGPSGTVNENASVLVEATVENAVSCSLNNGVGAVTITSGAISKTVPAKASYTLSCLSGYSDSVTSVLSLTVNPAPTVPTISNHVYDADTGTLALTWAEATDDDGVQGYSVYLNGQLIAILSPETTSYTFQNILPGVAYTAEVRAVDVLGAVSSASSVSINSEDLAAPASPNTGILQTNTAQAVLVAGLGILISFAAIFTTVTYRRRSQQ